MKDAVYGMQKTSQEMRTMLPLLLTKELVQTGIFPYRNIQE